MKEQIYAYLYGGNIYINLTNRCCNNCTFCLRNYGDGLDGNNLWLEKEPSAADVIEAVKKIYDATQKEMIFCGYGEPTYKMAEMKEVARFAHSLGLKTRLNTNGLGSLINGRDVSAELFATIDTVSVSLNQSDAKKYDEVSRSAFGERAFESLLDFTKKCAALGIDTVMTVVDVIGEDDVEVCRKIAENCGARLRVRKYSKSW